MYIFLYHHNNMFYISRIIVGMQDTMYRYLLDSLKYLKLL